ncbi:MAG: LysM peptidoglycan-binding domain-containing protein [Saonia sp.]
MLTKSILTLIAIVLFGVNAMAQQFATHAVKKGETLTSIAKQYKVTPFNILKFNKEIKQGDVLKPSTILVIPLDAKAPETADIVSEQKKEETVMQEEPIGFTTHRVRRKETLYGICKRYNISENDIKRYNRNLYSAQLKKGMRLKIPKYRRLRPVDTELDSLNFLTYTVKPKETRWSIAHKYGITIDSLLVLNPDLPKTTSYLAEGQQLKLPKPAGSSLEDQKTQLYISYTVPPKQTFYSLQREFGIGYQEIVKLNPEILERKGLKEGMVLRLPKKKDNTDEVNTENFIFYEVKPKQTEFSLTRNLGISYRELLDLNPDLKDGLKAGMVLKLPKEKEGEFEVKNALILDKINLLDSIDTANRPKLIFMLPFRLDRLNLKDTESTANSIEKRNDIKYSLGLYSGALVALDSIKKLGISVDVKTFDNQLSLARTKEILARENLNEVSAIIGPLDPQSLKEVAVQAANYQVPVIAPITANSDISLNNVFFSIPSDEVLRERILSFVSKKHDKENIIVIADKKHQDIDSIIHEKFPMAKSVEIKEEDKSIGINLNAFTALLSEENENWVFVETDNFKMVSSVSSILNSSITEDIKIKMFTTNKNKAFDNDVISGTHLSNLNFCYPSVYKEVGNDTFVKLYRKRFGSTPDRYAIRGFDITYDLLLKLAYKNDLFEASKFIGEIEYSANKFDYNKDISSGYFNTASYIMRYDTMWIKEVKL